MNNFYDFKNITECFNSIFLFVSIVYSMLYFIYRQIYTKIRNKVLNDLIEVFEVRNQNIIKEELKNIQMDYLARKTALQNIIDNDINLN